MMRPVPADDPDRLDAARRFAVAAARLADATHCRRVVVLDVRSITPITDFFVIATGTSPRQMRSVCDEIEHMARPLGFRTLSREGYQGNRWILFDFVDVVVHLFDDESRLYYDLDSLWGDAKPLDWKES
jgi:ribosome-associated protein